MEEIKVTDHQPNSNRYKEIQTVNRIPEKKVEKVVHNKVIVRKKTGFNKFFNDVIADKLKSAKTYIFGDVLIPTIKKAISDIVTDGTDILLYGDSRHARSSYRGVADRVSYRSYYDSPKNREREPVVKSSSFSLDDIIVSTRTEAEDLIDSMNEIIDHYTVVSVADLYAMIKINPPYTANKFGWGDISSA